MSDETEESLPPPPSGKKRRLLLLLMLVLVLGLGTGAFFYFQGSLFGTKAKGKKAKATKVDGEDPNAATDEASADDANADGGETKGKGKEAGLADDSKVKQVIELQPFIVNLSDKGEARYLRLTISLGIGEGKEEKPDSLFIARVRNALMSVMTSKTSDEVLNVEGKNALRRELLEAAQTASKEPKVYAIYITDFIVQL